MNPALRRAQVAVAAAFDHKAQIVLAREIDRGGDIIGGFSGDRIDAWGKHPSVDPASTFRRPRLVADKERVAQQLKDIAAGNAIRRADAGHKGRLNLDEPATDRLLQSVPFGGAGPQ
jgi:hypothetical protein